MIYQQAERDLSAFRSHTGAAAEVGARQRRRGGCLPGQKVFIMMTAAALRWYLEPSLPDHVFNDNHE